MGIRLVDGYPVAVSLARRAGPSTSLVPSPSRPAGEVSRCPLPFSFPASCLSSLFHFLSRSKKMAALTETLRKASLRKEDLDLELEDLEAAAQMVVEDEEEVGAGGSSPISSRDTSSSSSSSADESEASEAEEGGCADVSEEGGGGGGGETCKHNPLQPPHGSSGPPSLQEPSSSLVSAARTEDALPASGGCRQLIQELGERVAQELQISLDSRLTAEGGGSRPDDAAGTLLEPSPRRNPLLIVTTQEDVQLSNT